MMFTAEQLRMEILRRSVTSRPSSDDIASLTNEELRIQILESDLSVSEKFLYRIIIADSWSNSLNYDRAIREYDEILDANALKCEYPDIIALALLKKALVKFSSDPREFDSLIGEELKQARSLLRDFNNATGNPQLASICARLLETVRYSEITMRLYMTFHESISIMQREMLMKSYYGEPPFGIPFRMSKVEKLGSRMIESRDILNYICRDDCESRESLKDYAVRFATDSEHLYDMSWLRKHMVLMRYIVHSSEQEANEAGTAYCEILLRRKNASGPTLSHGYATPWEFIELYRAFLLEKMSSVLSDNQERPIFIKKAIDRLDAAFNSVCNHPYPYMGLKQCIIQTFLKWAKLYLSGKNWERGRLFQKNVTFLEKCSKISSDHDLKESLKDQEKNPGTTFRYDILHNYEEALLCFRNYSPRSIAWYNYHFGYEEMLRHSQNVTQHNYNVIFDPDVLQLIFFKTVPFALW